MAGSGAADDIIKGILKALEESRASSKVGEVAGAAESGLRDIITKLVEDAKGVAGVKPPKPPKPPKTPKLPEPPAVSAVPNEAPLSPKKLRSIENSRLHAAANEARIAELKASGMDRASRRIRNVEAHAASQEAKYGKGKGSNRATERDNVDIPKAPKTSKAPKVEEVKPKRARSANSQRLEAENELKDLRAMKAEGSLDQSEFAQGLKDAQKNGAKLTKKEQEIVTINEYGDGPSDWNDGSK